MSSSVLPVSTRKDRPSKSASLLGAATNLYSLASNLEGGKRSEDELAFGRIEKEYKNCLLVEKPNENFGHTMLKQLYFCVFMKLFWNECNSDLIFLITMEPVL